MSTSTGAPMAVPGLLKEIRAAQLPPPASRRRIRERARVTLRELASALGVSPMTVLRWEKGATVPKRQHAIAYARLLAGLENAAG